MLPAAPPILQQNPHLNARNRVSERYRVGTPACRATRRAESLSPNGLVRRTHVHGRAVRPRVDRHAGQDRVTAGPGNPDRDFPRLAISTLRTPPTPAVRLLLPLSYATYSALAIRNVDRPMSPSPARHSGLVMSP
jgi:hypothetical protein